MCFGLVEYYLSGLSKDLVHLICAFFYHNTIIFSLEFMSRITSNSLLINTGSQHYSLLILVLWTASIVCFTIGIISFVVTIV